MKRELVVLVKSEELPVHVERYNPFYGHYCTAHETGQKAITLSTEEAKAIARVQEFAKRRRMAFRIRSLSSLRVRLKYRLRRDEETPIVVLGRKLLRGVPSMSDLNALPL